MKNKVPFVSIVIPAKNEANYIGYCLQGVRNLNYDHQRIEVLVVDNGSVDSTIEVVRSMGYKVLVNSVAPSIAALRNYGAANVNGQLIGFVDADCIVNPDWLVVAVGHFNTDRNLCVVGVPEAPPHEGSTWVEETWTDLKHGQAPTGGFSYASWCASGALLIKRKSFDAIGGFTESLATCEDADLSKRVSQLGTIIMDYTVPFQHLRGSRSLIELFKREMWRGKHNIFGFFSHGVSLQELPSVVVPLIFVLSFTLGVISVIAMPWFPVVKYSPLIFFTVLLVLPFLMILKKIGSSLSFKRTWRAYRVCFVYLLARGLGSLFSVSRSW